MPRHFRTLVLIAIGVMIALVGCDSASTDTAAPTSAPAVRAVSAADAVQMLESRTVIDVRTPAEYDAGHVDGALLIDVQAADFEERIAELDPGAPYLVYCRSGRRSAIAAEAMADAGFTDIVDAGGFDALAQAGAPTA